MHCKHVLHIRFLIIIYLLQHLSTGSGINCPSDLINTNAHIYLREFYMIFKVMQNWECNASVSELAKKVTNAILSIMSYI